jgi:hypothetical protein
MAAWVPGGLEGNKVVIPILPYELSELVHFLFKAPSEPDPAPDLWPVSRVMVKPYAYPAEECWQVLSTQVLPTLRVRWTFGYDTVRLPPSVLKLELVESHRPTLRLDVRVREHFLKVRHPVPRSPHLRIYCTAIDRYMCTVHCEAETFKITSKDWLNEIFATVLRFHPYRLAGILLPRAIIPSMFLDDERLSFLQQALEDPRRFFNTIYEQSCQIIFRKIHASLTQALAGTAR